MARNYYRDGLSWYEVIAPTIFGEGEVRFETEPTEEELIKAFPNYPEAKKQMINANNHYERSMAYQQEADPLYFKAQRGECSIDEWLAKVNEIKQRWIDL